VINAAAVALGTLDDERTFLLMLSFSETRLMPGVIRALGGYRRSEAVPRLVAALEDDDCHPMAETGLGSLGVTARPALLAAASEPLPENASESRLRAVRSILELRATGIPRTALAALNHLMQHKDPRIAVWACKIDLANAALVERKKAICRLSSLLPQVDWILRQDIEVCLAEHRDDPEKSRECRDGRSPN
jgi:hypothetical protein